ncbi:hypothetical protein Vadar_027536 [Vaccinium darrowii]|uniref:Uncharacterized protein n=1 Tax=Vaccinium darrowii TaxID=229202 RepID=A0ACB7XDD2_9ERIC|nr:hypothetical protein Vadar_027536 [Vaccinium darrowii]
MLSDLISRWATPKWWQYATAKISGWKIEADSSSENLPMSIRICGCSSVTTDYMEVVLVVVNLVDLKDVGVSAQEGDDIGLLVKAIAVGGSSKRRHLPMDFQAKDELERRRRAVDDAESVVAEFCAVGSRCVIPSTVLHFCWSRANFVIGDAKWTIGLMKIHSGHETLVKP